MMNVSDNFVARKNNSFDFEDFTTVTVGFDSWSASQNDQGNLTVTHNTTSVTVVKEDCNAANNIISQSIDIYGTSTAPWPSTKSIPEQVAGIFLTTESNPPKDDSVQSRLEANKPQIQSRLRRSASTNRRTSISRINEENCIESQRIYKELEPIPIITVAKIEHEKFRSPVSAKDVENLLECQKERKPSRLQSWLAVLYTKATSVTTPTRDEESALCSDNFDKKPLKGILKKPLVSLNVQKSVSIPETEVASISNITSPKPKQSPRLRFDNEVKICETFHKEDYSRQSLDYVARQLTPNLALQIKKELNEVKQEMEVHEEARHLTQFYLIK